MMESFVLSIRQTCETAKQQTEGAFVCDDSVAQATAGLQLLQLTPCCDVNTDYRKTVTNMQVVLQTLDDNFDSTWGVESSNFASVVAQQASGPTAEGQIASDTQSQSTYTPGSVPSSTNDWKAFGQFLQKSITDFFKKLWKILIGKNVKHTQTPWITQTGKNVPTSIYWVWISTHIATIGVTVFELFGTLTRSHKLKGLFGAPRRGEHPSSKAADEGKGGFSNVQFSSMPRQRRRAQTDEII
jgi:hypothetical protein